MSQPPEVEQAYHDGYRDGGLLGHKNGMVLAYLEMQQTAMTYLRSALPYTDTRAAEDMLEHCNGRLRALNDGTIPGSLAVMVEAKLPGEGHVYVKPTEHGIPMPEEVNDGSEQESGERQQPEG